MKLKIREALDTVIPKIIEGIYVEFFALTVNTTEKYTIYYSDINVPNILYQNTAQKIILYDGVTGSHTSFAVGVGNGKTGSAEFAALGAQFTPNINDGDIPGLSGIYIISTFGMTSAASNLALQGITSSTTNRYGWINLETPWETYILFNGFTGPSDSTAIDNRTKALTVWHKILLGGTGTNSSGISDGTTFLGIKQVFPGVSWGWYGQPGPFPYYFPSSVGGGNVLSKSDAEMESIVDKAAEEWVNLGPWSEKLDLLMPSLYISVNDKNLEEAHNKWSIRLCKKVNEKFVAKGISAKPIVPFVSPISQTQATGLPYLASGSSVYMPPGSILTNKQMEDWFLKQLVDENVDGIQVWQSMAYAAKTIIGRQLYSGTFVSSGYTYPFCYEEQPLGYSGPSYSPCSGNLGNSWRKGPDNTNFNHFSNRSLSRQAISAYVNYAKGVCMGITANFWWYNEISGSTAHTPGEWTPLSMNRVWGMTAGVTAGTGVTGIDLVHETLFDASRRCIQTYKTLIS